MRPLIPLRAARFFLFGFLATFLSSGSSARAADATTANPSLDWVTENLLGRAADGAKTKPFFSFVYGGKPSADLLPTWKVDRATARLDANREQHTITYTDSASGLVVRCVAIQYDDFPTVEWTLYFRNTGAADTPIIEAVLPLDTGFAGSDPAVPVLHYNDGGYMAASAFQPHQIALTGERSVMDFSPGGGRGSNTWLPYFNFECGEGGVIVAVGWPGEWRARFDGKGQVQAGQELTHFLLHPGEEVRTPLIALQFWKTGDWIDAQNVWRRWMLVHNFSTKDGETLPPQFAACSSHQFGEMIHADKQNQIQFIDRYLEHGIKLSYWWMDAGWYSTDGIWSHVGTWKVDTKRFPGGLRAISDHAHEKGVKTIVWFEPERVSAGSWIWDNHPDWLLGQDPDQRLLNLGNPEALKWASDYFSRFITDQGIDLYRQDYNIAPLSYWRDSDRTDRQGITEIRYIEGYLAYWDALRKAHPGMLIDSCASGGRRDDLETMRRSVPLLRSDYILEPLGQQGHTFGLSSWLPYQGTGTGATDPYHFRSCMVWHFTACFDMREATTDYASAAALFKQWERVSPYFLADYYPLTPYSLSENSWIAWQFDRPQQGDGIVQAFRRSHCPDSNRFRLRGLKPTATYVISDIDGGPNQQLTGRQLMEEGLPVTVSGQPGAAIYLYQLSGN